MSFIPTEKQANDILGAFGPCTVVYECNDVSDIIRDAEESRYTSARQLVDSWFDIEEIHMDRFNDAACHREEAVGPKGYHEKVIREGDLRLSGARKRLNKLLKTITK